MTTAMSSSALTIQGPTDSSINSLRRINSLLLPVAYPEKVYTEVMEDPINSVLTRLAFWEDECIGGIRCRLEEESDRRRIYVMTLAVLAPYRRLSVGTHLLNYIVDTAAKHPLINATEVYAHVWLSNADALEFYKSVGFDTESGEVVKGYYRRLKPNEARVVTKAVAGATTTIV